MYINAGEAGGYVVVQGWASGPVRWYGTHGRNVGTESPPERGGKQLQCIQFLIFNIIKILNCHHGNSGDGRGGTCELPGGQP